MMSENRETIERLTEVYAILFAAGILILVSSLIFAWEFYMNGWTIPPMYFMLIFLGIYMIFTASPIFIKRLDDFLAFMLLASLVVVLAVIIIVSFLFGV